MHALYICNIKSDKMQTTYIETYQDLVDVLLANPELLSQRVVFSPIDGSHEDILDGSQIITQMRVVSEEDSLDQQLFADIMDDLDGSAEEFMKNLQLGQLILTPYTKDDEHGGSM